MGLIMYFPPGKLSSFLELGCGVKNPKAQNLIPETCPEIASPLYPLQESGFVTSIPISSLRARQRRARQSRRFIPEIASPSFAMTPVVIARSPAMRDDVAISGASREIPSPPAITL